MIRTRRAPGAAAALAPPLPSSPAPGPPPPLLLRHSPGLPAVASA